MTGVPPFDVVLMHIVSFALSFDALRMTRERKAPIHVFYFWVVLVSVTVLLLTTDVILLLEAL